MIAFFDLYLFDGTIGFSILKIIYKNGFKAASLFHILIDSKKIFISLLFLKFTIRINNFYGIKITS